MSWGKTTKHTSDPGAQAIKHSQSFCRHSPPAVGSASQEEAAWRPCGEARRPPAPSAGLYASAPCPRTCSAASPPALHSAGPAVKKQVTAERVIVQEVRQYKSEDEQWVENGEGYLVLR